MIDSIAYQNKIVIYWDLPPNYQRGDLFVIKAGESIAVQTKNFHCEIPGLCENTDYVFNVFHQKSDGSVCEFEHIESKTSKKKNIIDISMPPFSAVGDGKTINTNSIQRAIDCCDENSCVYIPAGDFLTGSLRLHSDMSIFIDKNAILHGTCNVEDYEPKIMSRFEGTELMSYAGLLNIGILDRCKGINCSNVRIFGNGTVCGGGIELAQNVINIESKLQRDYISSLGDKISEFEKPETIPGRVRPRLINISCASNVLISGITIMNGASWNVHMIYSKNIITHNCRFISKGVWNGDGWDPDSSENCTIFGCEFYTGDDAIAIKSGKNPEGNTIAIPCKHIKIFDCVSHYGHGIAIGSEMSGGIDDVKIWNCDMKNTVYGVEIKATKKRGGYVKNVSVSHCDLCRILVHSVEYNDDGPPAPTPPVISDLHFNDIKLTSVIYSIDDKKEYCNPIEITGFDSDGYTVKRVALKNINISNATDTARLLSLSCCEEVSFENICCR